MKRLTPIALLVVVLGCSETPVVDGGAGGGGGSASGGGAGGGTAGVTLADFCARRGEAICAFSIRCGAAAAGADCQKVLVPGRGSQISQSNCLSDSVLASLDAGLTRYHGDRAEDCFAAMATAAACNPYSLFVDPNCQSVITGTATQGQPCYGDDCTPELYCDSTASVCPGTCRPRAGAGGVVTLPPGCEVGTVSWRLADGGILCRAPLALGEDCGAAPGGCAPPNSCLPLAANQYTCQPLKSVGQPCLETWPSCTMDAYCSRVDGGSQCVARGRSGEPCGGCQTGLACTGNVCGPLVAAGGACLADSECVAGHLCGPGQVCQPFGGADAGCTTGSFTDDCEVGLFCNGAARCEARRGLDAPCTGAECSFEQGLQCTPPGDGGTPRCRPVRCLAP